MTFSFLPKKIVLKKSSSIPLMRYLEGNKQIILTSDRYPKEIEGVEDRLKVDLVGA